MNYRQIIMSTIKGEPTGLVPFVPRLDLWYKANRRNGTLPEKYRNATLYDITDDMGIGYHAVIPDFRDFLTEMDDVDLGLGIHRFKTAPYRIALHNVGRKIHRDSGLTTVEYSTPYGNIRTKVLYDEVMEKSGATLPHTVEHAVKGVKDFKAAAYIFSNLEVVPDYEGIYEFIEQVGERGPVVAFCSVCSSAMHWILKELMPFDAFFYESYDHPDEMEELAASIAPVYSSMFEAAAGSPADIVFAGGNYDSSMTTPPFFEKHIMPTLQEEAGQLHRKGKYLLTHTDGENIGLLDIYLKSGFDIADSVCPSPMTSMSLKEVWEKFKGKITIWGGIPSVSVLPETMDDYEFEKYLDMTLESIGNGDHIIFSIADTTPPGAKFERILRIAAKVKEIGRRT